jgi:hypothetical protein
VISGDTYGNLWLPRWKDHPDAQISKIGYKIQIELEDGEIIEQQILRPSDTVGDYNDYVEIWIYDDIYNLNASWYSHLTEDDFTQDSLCTSIKLTAGDSISQVTAIDLSVFIYTGMSIFLMKMIIIQGQFLCHSNNQSRIAGRK